MPKSVSVTCVAHAVYGGPAGRFGLVGFCAAPVFTTSTPIGILFFFGSGSFLRMGMSTMLVLVGRLYSTCSCTAALSLMSSVRRIGALPACSSVISSRYWAGMLLGGAV